MILTITIDRWHTMPSLQITFLLFVCQFLTPALSSDKVRLTDIKTLSFHNGAYTTGRRSRPVPQMTCISGSACGQSSFKPSSAQCYNQGSDGFDVQWKCSADLDNSVRFGQTIVTCEGYDYPDDPYVLKGSCGLEYALELVNPGAHSGYQGSSYNSNNHKGSNDEVPSALSGFGSLILCVGFIMFVLWMCSSGTPGSDEGGSSGRSSGYPGGGGGGGGGMGWHPPDQGPRPPPYGDPGFDGGDTCGGNSFSNPGFNFGGNNRAGAYRRPNQNGPGFWSGMATGGLMGYMFGGNRNSGYGNNYATHNYSRPGPSHGSSWGFGGASSGQSSSGAGFSGGSRNATGFGGTRRR
ncbi:store-operated calcium entry-associated regulatory factor-like [Symsagittifera roscoffensis]|uniref:store-operated calcium entry-associated regulatory factor-like n=1 Tax=Symsagittifera roscoffensis TaxID=84072 RepID=UPI00307BD97E